MCEQTAPKNASRTGGAGGYQLGTFDGNESEWLSSFFPEPASGLRTDDNGAVRPPPLSERYHLAIDPSFRRSPGLRVVLSNITKDRRSPLIRPSHPWEVTYGYASVVWSPEQRKYLAFMAGEMCCSGGPDGGPPRIWDGDCANSSLTANAWDDAAKGAAETASSSSAPPPSSCVCHEGMEFKCVPQTCVVGSAAPAASNDACEARCIASAKKDPLNGCFASSFELATRTCSLHSTFARPIAHQGFTGCQCRDLDKPAAPLRDVIQCSPDGTGSNPPMYGPLHKRCFAHLFLPAFAPSFIGEL